MPAGDKLFYPSGHDQTVLRSHRTRNAGNSAPHLLPHLRSTDSLLDIGCGPGTITCSLAKHVARAVGIEHPSAGEAVLEGAREEAKAQGVGDKVSFEFANALKLPYEDGSIDVVYCHQVLQHVSDPVAVLREMRRVSRRLVCVREADRGTMSLYPPDSAGYLARFDQMWYAVSRSGGGEPDAGRRLKSWALAAGFQPSEIEVTAGNSTPDPREWGEMWSERVVKSDLATKAIDLGLATTDELDEMSRAWKEWSGKPDAWFGYVQGDLLAWKGERR
ncbi:methylase involvedin ubiquinone/menaquinone biosynthesis [Rhodotorula toruloides]|uniref:Methylase involvedin ubiquinone/menaquinone biosynthesis n=1 Tax=Rhodotorula toruloides TaxID=5286 RepID=A0A511KN26_RHOTO|nr:methylase involvedin ubiquinone/menaquinone biosynthesis [Rhodotorula toruloides]